MLSPDKKRAGGMHKTGTVPEHGVLTDKKGLEVRDPGHRRRRRPPSLGDDRPNRGLRVLPQQRLRSPLKIGEDAGDEGGLLVVALGHAGRDARAAVAAAVAGGHAVRQRGVGLVLHGGLDPGVVAEGGVEDVGGLGVRARARLGAAGLGRERRVGRGERVGGAFAEDVVALREERVERERRRPEARGIGRALQVGHLGTLLEPPRARIHVGRDVLETLRVVEAARGEVGPVVRLDDRREVRRAVPVARRGRRLDVVVESRQARAELGLGAVLVHHLRPVGDGVPEVGVAHGRADEVRRVEQSFDVVGASLCEEPLQRLGRVVHVRRARRVGRRQRGLDVRVELVEVDDRVDDAARRQTRVDLVGVKLAEPRARRARVAPARRDDRPFLGVSC
mmetsp:Transcript_27194/g.108880  ORF Transcript_27194/g.108880 Transcript_27194/m.108880 type:complete len:392 (+) Transcript_27194:73-1248(+)